MKANKLMKSPAVMSNQELVELSMGSLSLQMGQSVLQFLGGATKKKTLDKGKEAKSEDQRRPED